MNPQSLLVQFILSCCLLSACTSVLPLPGTTDQTVELSSGDAHLVRRFQEGEPQNEWGRCAYWRKVASQTPPAPPDGIETYTQYKRDAVCMEEENLVNSLRGAFLSTSYFPYFVRSARIYESQERKSDLATICQAAFRMLRSVVDREHIMSTCRSLSNAPGELTWVPPDEVAAYQGAKTERSVLSHFGRDKIVWHKSLTKSCAVKLELLQRIDKCFVIQECQQDNMLGCCQVLSARFEVPEVRSVSTCFWDSSGNERCSGTTNDSYRVGEGYCRSVSGLAEDEDRCVSRRQSRSCIAAAEHYVSDRYGTEDAAKWRELLTTGCNGGDSQACTLIFEDNDKLRSSCGSGVTFSCIILGFWLERRTDLPRGQEEIGKSDAAELYSAACKLGSAEGCYRLAQVNRLRSGVGKNELPAVLDGFKDACLSGSPEGCYELGSLYDGGKVMPRIAEQAAIWYGRACDEGYGTGCSRLSTMCRRKEGMPTGAVESDVYRDRCRRRLGR